MHKSANGNFYLKDGRLHREDGPAVEYDDGTCQFWLNGRHYPDMTYEQWIIKNILE